MNISHNFSINNHPQIQSVDLHDWFLNVPFRRRRHLSSGGNETIDKLDLNFPAWAFKGMTIQEFLEKYLQKSNPPTEKLDLSIKPNKPAGNPDDTNS